MGPVLADSKGFTVYLLTADTPGHSTCSVQCLQYWPPVPTPAGSGAPSVQGISAALTATKATSGATMVTAGGWPLYTFVKDKAPGDVAGEGVKTFGRPRCGGWPGVFSAFGLETSPMAPQVESPCASGREPQNRLSLQGPYLHGRDVPASS